MTESKNIYQRINNVMRDCDYLQKKSAQQGKGIKYDEVVAMIREHLINHGIVMRFYQDSFDNISGVDGTKQKIYQGRYTMELINMDKPDDKVTHTVYAHGMDGGDKAPGKAYTYAVKMMLVKGFGIETGEDEESRSEKIDKQNTISQEQHDILASYCLDYAGGNITGWSIIGLKVSKAYKIGTLNDLPASKYKEVCNLVGIE